MLIRENHAGNAMPLGTLGVQLLIVTIAVAVAALVVAQPALLIPAIGLTLAVTVFLNFDWFVYATIFLLPWSPFAGWKFPVRDISLIAHFVLFAGVWMLRRSRGESTKEWLLGSRLKQGVLLVGAIAATSLALGPPANSGTYPALAKMLSYIALFFAFIGWLKTPEQLVRAAKILFISTLGVCLFGFYQAFEQDFTALYFRLYPFEEANFDAQGGWAGRITSLFFHYNSLAGYLSAVAPLALGATVLAKDRWLRYLGFLALTAAIAAVYLTGSRGGMAACAGVLFLGVWYLSPRRTTLAIVISSLILAAAIALPLAPAEAGGSRLQGVDDFTRESRLALWGAAGAMFLQHPILGVGFGNYKFLMHDYIPGLTDDLDAHNLYLQWLAETGIVGFAVFFLIMGSFTRIGLRLRKAADPVYRMWGIGLCGAIVATLIHGLVDYIFNVSPQFGNLFWLLLALGLCASEMWRKQSAPLSRGMAAAR